MWPAETTVVELDEKLKDYDSIWGELEHIWRNLPPGGKICGKHYYNPYFVDIAPAVQGWARENKVIVQEISEERFVIEKPGGSIQSSYFQKLEFSTPFNHCFNPSIILDSITGILLFAFRTTSYGWSNGRIWVAELDEVTLKARTPPELLGFGPSWLNYEDPRLFSFNGATWISATVTEFSNPIRNEIAIACLGKNHTGKWELTSNPQLIPSPVGKRQEKNWIFFEHNRKLHFLWACDPWTIMAYDFNNPDDVELVFQKLGIKWKYGHIRGSSPLLLMPNGKFWAFFHSNDAGRYVTGLMEIEPETLLPSKITLEPLFPGEPVDPGWFGVPTFWIAGAVLKNDNVLMACGISNHECWIRMEKIGFLQEKLANYNWNCSIPIQSSLKE